MLIIILIVKESEKNLENKDPKWSHRTSISYHIGFKGTSVLNYNTMISVLFIIPINREYYKLQLKKTTVLTVLLASIIVIQGYKTKNRHTKTF